MPKRVVARHQPAVGQLLEQSPQREIGLLGDPRQNPIPLSRHQVGLWPPIFSAAGVPTARCRCDHFTTLATLTVNVLATERQLSPAATAAPAPASPKSKLAPFPPASNPSQQLESDSRLLGNLLDSVNPDRALGSRLNQVHRMMMAASMIAAKVAASLS
jgi:hypothetical protein